MGTSTGTETVHSQCLMGTSTGTETHSAWRVLLPELKRCTHGGHLLTELKCCTDAARVGVDGGGGGGGEWLELVSRVLTKLRRFTAAWRLVITELKNCTQAEYC